MEKTLRKPDELVSTTFLRHFIFDGAVLLIIYLKFFSGNTDLFFNIKPLVGGGWITGKSTLP